MPRKRIPSPPIARGMKSSPAASTTVWKIKRADVEISGIGEAAILGRKCLGLICSVQCPGSIVIKTFDAIRELRDAGITVAGGFHSPMEKECLDFLLRGQQPVIVVPAKGLARPRVPDAWKAAISAGRLLLLSPFADAVRRTTKTHAQVRNEFVATLATAVLIPHASPGGKADALSRSILQRGQTLFTFSVDENHELLQLGALPYNSDAIKSSLAADQPPAP